MNSIHKHTLVGLVSVAASLVAIWPLPETIALRHLLLVIGLALSFPIVRAHASTIMKKEAWPLWVLAASFLWVLVHLAFFSVNVDEQLHELRNIWLNSFIAAVIGLSLGLVLANQNPMESSQPRSNTLELVLFAGFVGTVAIFFLRYIYEIYVTSQWIHKDFYMTPYKSKTPIVIFGAIFLPLAYIKILRVIVGRDGLYWSALASIGVLLALFADFFADTKNGILMLVFVSSIFLLNLPATPMKSKGKQYIWMFIVAVFVIVAFGVKKHYDSNPVWHTLWPDIKASVDIDHQEYWKYHGHNPLPTTESGIAIDSSTNVRIAWAVAGVRLIKENPQGYGLINHSFGALAIKKWPNFHQVNAKTRGATHSGWIDFTLGLGLPGLLLVLVPLWVCFWRALHKEGFWYSYIVWTVPTITLAYLTTEVSFDHFIELLFFMAAFFCGMTLKPNRRSQNPAALTPALSRRERE